ncbi:helix-turn-helix domain-containing protein [Providencia rettgeri]|uniref:helix-turn-helix domain-containing protein n=1 Tax=Providencia rettgeri TaxID=587 RepID=UPI0023AA838E|nr:helix-turn-helix transcriptional regulator [Providencia rettgeri]
MGRESLHIYSFSSIMGAEIAYLRRERLLSGKELGGLVGLSQQQISRYERGVCEVSVVTLCSLLHQLDVSLDSFFYFVVLRLKKSQPLLYTQYNSLFKTRGEILFKAREKILKARNEQDVYAWFEK